MKTHIQSFTVVFSIAISTFLLSSPGRAEPAVSGVLNHFAGTPFGLKARAGQELIAKSFEGETCYGEIDTITGLPGIVAAFTMYIGDTVEALDKTAFQVLFSEEALSKLNNNYDEIVPSMSWEHEDPEHPGVMFSNKASITYDSRRARIMSIHSEMEAGGQRLQSLDFNITLNPPPNPVSQPVPNAAKEDGILVYDAQVSDSAGVLPRVFDGYGCDYTWITL